MRTLYTQVNGSMYAYGLHFIILFYIIYDFVLTGKAKLAAIFTTGSFPVQVIISTSHKGFVIAKIYGMDY